MITDLKAKSTLKDADVGVAVTAAVALVVETSDRSELVQSIGVVGASVVLAVVLAGRLALRGKTVGSSALHAATQATLASDEPHDPRDADVADALADAYAEQGETPETPRALAQLDTFDEEDLGDDE